MAEAYDYRTNFKNKPSSQGTLFQVRDKGLLHQALRWPRGYTPDRQRDISDALKTTGIDYPPHMEDDHEPGDYREMNAYRPRVIDAIARSKVEPHHLGGLREITGTPDEGTEGTYYPGKKEIRVDMSDRSPRGRKTSAETLVHEIGHHVDNMTGETKSRAVLVAESHAQKELDSDPHLKLFHDQPNTSMLLQHRAKVESGVAEAVADNFMVQHASTGGRKPKGVAMGAYEMNYDPHELAASYPGYHDVRPPRVHGPQFTETQGDLFKVRHEGDGTKALVDHKGQEIGWSPEPDYEKIWQKRNQQ